jgi:hypothetical protein
MLTSPELKLAGVAINVALILKYYWKTLVEFVKKVKLIVWGEAEGGSLI